MLEAVIEIGSTGIRLMACQTTDQGSYTVLDYSDSPIALGNDVFTTGYISRDTLMQALLILNRYREQLLTWGLAPKDVQVIATSALRESKNRDNVIDRILVKTGFSVRVIDGIEENRLMYLAVQEAMKQEQEALRTTNSVILEVSGGSTEIMVLDHGNMAAVHTLRFGTVIIDQHLARLAENARSIRQFLSEFVSNTGMSLNYEINLSQIQTFITMGLEPRIAAQTSGRQIREHLWHISKENYNRFTDTVQAYAPEECMTRFNISYNEAKSFTVGLLAYKLFLNLTGATELMVTDLSIREGLVLNTIAAPNASMKEEFYTQMVASARNLGRKYHYDERHALHVRDNALKLYDFMGAELGLEPHARELLELAAILHDVGTFIRVGDHNLHSQYIIAHSDIFGLSKEDMNIISRVARYHRGSTPHRNDETFLLLHRAVRITILKLTAILRVADALDRSHSQKIKDFEPELRGDTLILRISGTQDSNLEKMALAEKGETFEIVFGYKLLLL